MIDWADIYSKVMVDFKGERLIPHLILIGIFVFVGIGLGMYFNHNTTLILLIWAMGAILDYLIFGRQLIDLFTKRKPYVIEGEILQRIKKSIFINQEESQEFYFVIHVQDAFIISNQGADSMDYLDKEGIHRFKVPQSMFLSLHATSEVALVCMPNDMVWGIIKEDADEVICIES